MAKIIKTHCNDCDKETNQDILFKKRKSSDESWIEDYMIVQCRGCDEPSFVIRLSGTDLSNDDGGDNFIDINYPEEDFDEEANMLTYEEIGCLPPALKNLYREIRSAVNQDSNILVGVGLRILTEAICMEQKITGGNLKLKIQALANAGLISRNEIPILDKLREIGNTSAHEIKAFSMHKLSYALDIINHVLKSIYVLPRINKKLKLDPNSGKKKT